ncbi:MAG: serine/threonine transporter SstT [Lachnospirales bacterium]
MKDFLKKWEKLNLITRILIGIILGVTLAIAFPNIGTPITLLGDLFLNALKGVAPLLVFVLVMSAIANHKSQGGSNIAAVIKLYIISTLIATMLAVFASKLFPTMLEFNLATESITAPSGVGEILKGLALRVVDNPIKALYDGNYIGILTSAILFGISLRGAADSTKTMLIDFEKAISNIVNFVINLAPIGIMGIIYTTITVSGFDSLMSYTQLLAVIIGTEFFIAFVVNPLIVWYYIRKNPYPLVLRCLKESGITAFFTMSSAANIPINLKLCESLGLNKDTYSVTIPLGATINMSGSAITLNILALAAAYSIGIDVGIVMSIIVSLVSAVSAAGTAGIAGGAVLLIPVACGALGIPEDISLQVVSIGLIITVVQDAFTTALNSSTDVILTATAEYANKRKNGLEF